VGVRPRRGHHAQSWGGRRRFSGCSRTARSTGQAPPMLGLPAKQQGVYGGSTQGCSDGEAAKAAGMVVVLKR
jgi:hypothetical protein